MSARTKDTPPGATPRQHISEADSGGAGEDCVSAPIEGFGKIGGWITSAGSSAPKIVVDRPGHPFDGEYTREQALDMIADQLELAAYLSYVLRIASREA